MNYLKRFIEPSISTYLSLFPAVAVTGPRQSGKSTTLRERFCPEYRYVTFDDPMQIDFFKTDPEGFFRKYSGRTIFDEAQKVPLLFNYLKIRIDNNRNNYGKYLLTGSSQFAFIKEITESLAGRIGMLSLLPFQRFEIPEPQRNMHILRGGYPELILRNYEGSDQWYASYIHNYIERDVRSLYNIGSLHDFRRLVMLTAARAAQELNMSSLAKELGVNVKTVQTWLSILEASYIIFFLPAYHKNLGKRIVKRPKLYFYDTGLICYLTGISTEAILNRGPMAGQVFENYVLSELKKTIHHYNRTTDMYYFRSNAGLEADVILEDRKKHVIRFLEIKNSHTARASMVDTLTKLIDLEKQTEHPVPADITGTLVYRGESIVPFARSCTCMNYEDLLEYMRE